jgi:uncharacterized protein YqeY
MGLKERLLADLQAAMRAQDTMRKDVIRMARAAITNAEIAAQHEASDQEVIEVLKREVKKRQESITLFRQGGREEAARQEEIELAVLQTYLPQQLSEQEVRQVVSQVIAETGASGPAQLGAVMKRAMEQFKGQADGRLVNQVARELLSR